MDVALLAGNIILDDGDPDWVDEDEGRNRRRGKKVMLDDGDPNWADEDEGRSRPRKKRKTGQLERLDAMVSPTCLNSAIAISACP